MGGKAILGLLELRQNQLHVYRERPVDFKQITSQITGIDDFVLAKLAGINLMPFSTSGDWELLRRVYLDVTGLLPRAEKIAVFLDRNAERVRKARGLTAGNAMGSRLSSLCCALLFVANLWSKRFCHISRFVALAPTGWYMKFVIGTSG